MSAEHNYDHAHVLDGVHADASRRFLCGDGELVEAVDPQLGHRELDSFDLHVDGNDSAYERCRLQTHLVEGECLLCRNS